MPRYYINGQPVPKHFALSQWLAYSVDSDGYSDLADAKALWRRAQANTPDGEDARDTLCECGVEICFS